MSNPVKNAYEKGKCPDCAEDIPDNVVEGQSCINCGHVFWSASNFQPFHSCKVRVISSPYPQDDGFPAEYEEQAFLDWVDEVFREGYKKDISPIELDTAIELLEELGYDVEIIPSGLHISGKRWKTRCLRNKDD